MAVGDVDAADELDGDCGLEDGTEEGPAGADAAEVAAIIPATAGEFAGMGRLETNGKAAAPGFAAPGTRPVLESGCVGTPLDTLGRGLAGPEEEMGRTPGVAGGAPDAAAAS